MMANLYRNTALVIALVLLAMAAVYPPQDKLRLGKDLAGGVSLTYTIFLSPDDPPETVDRMIEVLKRRVNPQGLYEISFVQQGRDRLIVTMPLPSDEVKALRDAFEQKMSEFERFSVDQSAFQRAMRQSGEERRAAIERLIGESEARRALLEPVLAAADEADEAVDAFESAAAEFGEESPEASAAADAAADAQEALNAAMSAVAERSISPQRVRQALQLSDVAPRVQDDVEGREPLPSPQDAALRSIRRTLETLPGGEEQLDETLALWDEYNAKRRGLDDPADLERLLRGAGVLEYRIAVEPGEIGNEDRLRQELRERGPEGVESDTAVWVQINSIDDWYESIDELDALQANPAAYFEGRRFVVEERDGLYYMLLYDQPGLRLTQAEGEWRVARGFPTQDQLGRPAIGFEMDARGAVLMGQLTSENLQEPMAIVLDDRVISRPATIQSRISSNGQISGSFSQAEISYVVQTLSAGSLSAKLSERPISTNTIAPDLGADNLRQGLQAGWIALVAVGVFMVIYYFQNGVIALIALAVNAVLILGIMSLARASFTLPGIAGIVLTFGMAVDANVLIYERLREELLAGNDAKTSVRLAFQKVFSTIIDANITNLIVCFVLAYTATEEVKGFAITLGIGVVCTMFSSLIVTRMIYTWLVDRWGVDKLAQLPMVVPPLQKALEPRLDFIKLRPVFILISAVLVGLGVTMITVQGSEMLDTEFRGGTAITLKFTDGETGDPTTLERPEVERRINAIAEEAGEQSPLFQLKNADIVAIDPEADGITSDRFQIKTVVGKDSDQERQALLASVVESFQDVIDSRPALQFLGSGTPTIGSAPVFKILDDRLGSVIGKPEIRNDVSEFVGGVAILMEDIRPRVSEQAILDRLDYIRNQPDFASNALKRTWRLIVIEGTEDAVESAVVVAKDPAVSVFDEDEWRTELASSEWQMVRDGLTQPTTLALVQQFSAEIAQSFRAQAIVAVILSFLLILIYIWVRFGSVRYSLAAITALVHDVTIAIGLIALAEILYANVPFLVAIGLQPYKIDLALVAAILTIVGYSLNDTIVILDRIRENRGKLAYASRDVVNLAISQTISRTVITSGTTLVALIVLFVLGGDALSSFTYALICGVLVGTYSSIAVAAPLVFTSKIPASATRYASVGQRGVSPEPDESLLPPDDRGPGQLPPV